MFGSGTPCLLEAVAHTRYSDLNSSRMLISAYLILFYSEMFPRIPYNDKTIQDFLHRFLSEKEPKFRQPQHFLTSENCSFLTVDLTIFVRASHRMKAKNNWLTISREEVARG